MLRKVILAGLTRLGTVPFTGDFRGSAHLCFQAHQKYPERAYSADDVENEALLGYFKGRAETDPRGL